MHREQQKEFYLDFFDESQLVGFQCFLTLEEAQEYIKDLNDFIDSYVKVAKIRIDTFPHIIGDYVVESFSEDDVHAAKVYYVDFDFTIKWKRSR